MILTFIMEHEILLDRAEKFVKNELSTNDASHDWYHVSRVRSLAITIAKKENVHADRHYVIALAALLHDVDDWKYQVGEMKTNRVQKFLIDQNCKAAIIREICDIIQCISFKDNLPHDTGKSMRNTSLKLRSMSIEAKIVHDADRLDAIGAIGIARCFTFGGAFKRVMHNAAITPRVLVSKEQYMENSVETCTTINHMYEKLMLLKDLMMTQTGKHIAMKRHSFMEEFLTQFHVEWNGSDAPEKDT